MESKEGEFDSTTKFDGNFNEQVDVFEQSLKKLNANTELFLKHQTEGIDKFVEMEAMKQASENERKEYFCVISERALIMQRNRLLELQIHQNSWNI